MDAEKCPCISPHDRKPYENPASEPYFALCNHVQFNSPFYYCIIPKQNQTSLWFVRGSNLSPLCMDGVLIHDEESGHKAAKLSMHLGATHTPIVCKWTPFNIWLAYLVKFSYSHWGNSAHARKCPPCCTVVQDGGHTRWTHLSTVLYGRTTQ